MTTDRRGFLASALGLVASLGQRGLVVGARLPSAATVPPVSLPPAVGAGAITEATVAEAEKVVGLELLPAQRTALVPGITQHVQAVEHLRRVSIPRELKPGLIFDPRLPGVTYPSQRKEVRLAARRAGPLPRDEADIAYAPVTTLAQWLRGGQLTSRRLTEIYLARIERIAPKLFCYITVTADRARAEADARDAERARGQYRGPLHGVPYALKDVFDTAGIPTTWGAAMFRNRVPDRDATIVRMLRDAGAVLLGKAATGELAYGTEWFGGNCRNPWNLEETAGGSSTGPGAATAAALCGFSIGTDSLGSILNPADRCGVVGLRATFGRVPVSGGMPLTPSLERIGPLCRGVEDAALVLAAINGPDPASPTSIDMGFAYDGRTDVRRLRVGYSPDWFKEFGFGPGESVPTSAAHHRALDALRTLGVQLVEVELPALPYRTLLENVTVEAATVFDDLTLSHKDVGLSSFTPWADTFRLGHFHSAVDYLEIERFRRRVMDEMHGLFSRVDAVFGPTYGSFDLFLVMNFTGQPGITLRAGFAESPTRAAGPGPRPANPNGPKHRITQNVAFHGRLFEEGKIIALARALESELGVGAERPPIG